MMQLTRYLIKLKCVTYQQTIINDALWCYGDAPADKSHPPDVREHACLVQTPAKITSLFLYFFQ